MTNDRDKIIKLWFEMYPSRVHETVGGYDGDSGEVVVVFINKRSKLLSHVCLKNGRLMPYFPKESNV